MRMMLLGLIALFVVLPACAQEMPVVGPGGVDRTMTLLKPDGTPAAGATIIARTFTGNTFAPDDYPRMTVEKTYTADAQGRFTLDLPVGNAAPYRQYADYALIIAADCCPTALPLSAITGQLRLLPAQTVAVALTLPDGVPAADARVMLEQVGGGVFYLNAPGCGVVTPQLVTQAGKDGVARVPLINTGRFERIATTTAIAMATATAGGAAYCAYPVNLPISPTPRDVTATLQPASTLSGVITAAGKPLAGALVRHLTLPLSAVTDANGAYQIAGIPRLPLNQQYLYINHPDYTPVWISPVLPAPKPVITALEPRITVHGRVRDAATGAPFAAIFSIRVMYTSGALGTETYTTAPDGSFTIRIPAKSSLEAIARGYVGSQAVYKQFTDNETVDLKTNKEPERRR